MPLRLTANYTVSFYTRSLELFIASLYTRKLLRLQSTEMENINCTHYLYGLLSSRTFNIIQNDVTIEKWCNKNKANIMNNPIILH